MTFKSNNRGINIKQDLFIIGIDPGLTGGIARIRFKKDGGFELYDVVRIPLLSKKRIDYKELYSELKTMRIDFAFIEEVWALPGQNIQSMFNFGMSYGGMLAILDCLNIKYHAITPITWKSGMGLSKVKAESTEKARIILDPENKLLKTNGLCEAGLIGYFGFTRLSVIWKPHLGGLL